VTTSIRNDVLRPVGDEAAAGKVHHPHEVRGEGEETARELAENGKMLSGEKIIEAALKEAESKISPIRETAVSPATKKQSLRILRRAMQELLAVLPS